MKVVYHCYGGTHSSVLAAAVHVGLLSPEERPSPDRLLSLSFYDKRDGNDYGRIVRFGQDETGNEVFILGRRNYTKAPEMVFAGLQSAFGLKTPIKVVDTSITLNWQMKLGGYLSRGLGLKSIGRLVVTWGSRLAYPQVVSLVESTRKEVQNS